MNVDNLQWNKNTATNSQSFENQRRLIISNMAGPGAPKGNANASRGRVWRDAIERALDKRNHRMKDQAKAIDELAERLLQAADAGDVSALRELGDRLEGKPAQDLNVAGDVIVQIVEYGDEDSPTK